MADERTFDVTAVVYPPGLYDNRPLPGAVLMPWSFVRWHGVVRDADGAAVDWVVMDGPRDESDALAQLRGYAEAFGV